MQLNGFKYGKWLISYIWVIDKTPIDTRSIEDLEVILVTPYSQNLQYYSFTLDYLMYPGHACGGDTYHSGEMQSACSTAPAGWAEKYEQIS